MPDAPAAYPLSWPNGWPRTPAGSRKPAAFRSVSGTGGASTYRKSAPIRLTDARQRVSDELHRLGARNPVLSTNLELRLDGLPRGGQAEPADPGAAVYFQLRKRPIVLACDRWNTVAGNIAAIAAHIEAMRGMERWGVGSVEQLFTGYLRLPAPMVPDDWRGVLGDPATLAEAEATWRRKIRDAHPDRGGSAAKAAALNAAIAAARSHFGNGRA